MPAGLGDAASYAAKMGSLLWSEPPRPGMRMSSDRAREFSTSDQTRSFQEWRWRAGHIRAFVNASPTSERSWGELHLSVDEFESADLANAYRWDNMSAARDRHSGSAFFDVVGTEDALGLRLPFLDGLGLAYFVGEAQLVRGPRVYRLRWFSQTGTCIEFLRLVADLNIVAR